MRKPSHYYGEWILNGLQQMSGPFKDFGGQGANKDTENKIAKKARTLQGNCSFFQ